MAMVDELVDPKPAASRRRIGITGAVTLASGLIVLAGLWSVIRPDRMPGVDEGSDTVAVYGSALAMAERVGCGDSFQPAVNAGNSLSAGQCRTGDGVLVEFRIYESPLETNGWLEGTQQHSAPGIPTFGGRWVALARTDDAAVANRIFRSL